MILTLSSIALKFNDLEYTIFLISIRIGVKSMMRSYDIQEVSPFYKLGLTR